MLALKETPEAAPDTSPAATMDRAIGALLGLAAGDAVGTSLEFKTRDSYPPLTDMVGGGPFGLKAGQWTDDTAMALALADSLTANDGLNEADLMAALRSLARAGRVFLHRQLLRHRHNHPSGSVSLEANWESDRRIDRSADRWQRQPDAIGPCRDPVLAGSADDA